MDKPIISKSAFKAGIVTTFGKLNDKDIEDCNCEFDRLATQLVVHYGWSSAYAQTRANELSNKLLTSPEVATEELASPLSEK